jgi:hypothetical protein
MKYVPPPVIPLALIFTGRQRVASCWPTASTLALMFLT